MGSSNFFELLKNLPDNVTIEPTAEKDLAKTFKKNPKEFKQIFEDIIRLGKGTLPPAGRKKLKVFDAWQCDVGRFRIVYKPSGSRVYILALFSKSEQSKRFHGMR